MPSTIAQFEFFFGDVSPAVIREFTPEIHFDVKDMSTEQKVERAIGAVLRLIEDGHPLACAWSGGKDSTCMAVLVLEAALRAKEAGTFIPQILFTHARTGIDNPGMDSVAKLDIERIRSYAAAKGLPVRVEIVEPSLNDSWAVRIISGRALPTFPNSATRDCAISWKLLPQQRQRKAVMNTPPLNQSYSGGFLGQ